MTELLRHDQVQTTEDRSAPPLAPATPPRTFVKIEKNQLAIGEPKRLRDKAHLKFVASQPCLICGKQPSDPHHLRFAQPRAIGLKVSDEFTVPLCRGHHREVHQIWNEKVWWDNLKINVLLRTFGRIDIVQSSPDRLLTGKRGQSVSRFGKRKYLQLRRITPNGHCGTKRDFRKQMTGACIPLFLQRSHMYLVAMFDCESIGHQQSCWQWTHDASSS